MMRVKKNDGNVVGVFSEDDKRILTKVKEVTSDGSNAEVRRKKDGTFTVYKVRKSVVQ